MTASFAVLNANPTSVPVTFVTYPAREAPVLRQVLVPANSTLLVNTGATASLATFVRAPEVISVERLVRRTTPGGLPLAVL